MKYLNIRGMVIGLALIIGIITSVLIVNLVIFEKMAFIISRGEPIDKIDENNYALLVIDIQEATTGNYSVNEHYIKNSEDLISLINRISQIFHSNDFPVIYIRSEISNPLINILNDSYAEGSEGVKFDTRLKLYSDIEVVKSKNDAFYGTGLDEVLIENRVNELFVVGLDAVYCINNTVEAALNTRYKINLIEDALLSESKLMKDSMMVVFSEKGINVLNSKLIDNIILH